MERERITISIKKNVLDKVDRTIDGTSVRNRSHAIESLILKGLGTKDTNSAVILLGGDDALKSIPNTQKIFAELKKNGFEKVNIAVGFLGDKVKEKIEAEESYGLQLIYNDKGEGSGGALSILKKELRGTFVVVNHNRFTEIEITHLLNFHKKHSFIATIATDSLDDMRGIYIFDPEVLNYIPKGFSMIEEDVLPKLIKDGKAVICPII